MDQAFTLRNLMSGRQGDPYASVSLLPRTQFFVPAGWGESTVRLLSDVASRLQSGSKSLLLVNRFQPEAGIARYSPKVYRVGAEKLESRLDDELAEVLGLERVWVVLPYLESEEDLVWASQSAHTVLLHGTDDAHVVDAYRQLRTLSGRCGVNKVSAFVVADCGRQDALRAHLRLEEMGNRFLDIDLGFLGKMRLNPEEYLLHLNAGSDYESRLESIAEKFREKFRLQPAQNARSEARQGGKDSEARQGGKDNSGSQGLGEGRQ